MSGAMRRIAPAVLVGTAAVLVVGAADPGVAALLTGGNDKTNKATQSTTGTTGAPSTASESGTGGTTSGGTDTSDGTGTGSTGTSDATGSPGTSDATGSGTGTTDSSACTGAEITGPIAQTEWGLVQVAAKVSNGRVCAIRTIMTPDGDRKSVSINARAVPELEAAVLAAGDANFDNISGATVTSGGYRESLQAILDQQ